MEDRTLLALSRTHHPGSSLAVLQWSSKEQEKPPLLQGQPPSSHHRHICDKDVAKELQDVAQGQGRIETAPESCSFPKNAGPSFSRDPETKSLPR